VELRWHPKARLRPQRPPCDPTDLHHLTRATCSGPQVPPGAQHHSSSDSSSTSDDERVTNFPDSASDEEEDGELVSSSEDEDERKPAPRKSKLPSKL
jgi:hypothetical protein